jgi:hypothetical protein
MEVQLQIKNIVYVYVNISQTRQEKRIFFLGAQPGDKNFLQTNGVFLCQICMSINI